MIHHDSCEMGGLKQYLILLTSEPYFEKKSLNFLIYTTIKNNYE